MNCNLPKKNKSVCGLGGEKGFVSSSFSECKNSNSSNDVLNLNNYFFMLLEVILVEKIFLKGLNRF